MQNEHTVLVAYGDQRRATWLAEQLRADGYQTDHAAGEREILIKARRSRPDLLIVGPLDRPTGHLELIGRIRAGDLAVEGLDRNLRLICEGPGDDLGTARSLDIGADAYHDETRNYVLLRAQVVALSRRIDGLEPKLRRAGDLIVDMELRTVSWKGRRIEVTRLEFELLAELATDPSRAIPKVELLKRVWGTTAELRTRTVDVHACRVRKHLHDAGATGFLVNVRGVGYRLQPLGEPDELATARLRAA